MHHALCRAARLDGASLLRTALPCACALCGMKREDAICEGCRKHIISVSGPRCNRCAIALPAQQPDMLFGDCLRHAPAFDAAIAAVDYAPPIDQMVLAL